MGVIPGESIKYKVHLLKYVRNLEFSQVVWGRRKQASAHSNMGFKENFFSQ